ncbi:hypothetical protein P3T36_002988 [Kitasatospora sp. MAP12-15]|uniref:hypothetical protein n=1 Tax=unclassified Kitasatospora TaxID=2633591 RepID=UPI002475802A|nr:hypothetical protein [Kitasatospora sp. MAP12-44]MDH6108857.1 hypothetical protein [Kitasatospora sp. MAP12-44]
MSNLPIPIPASAVPGQFITGALWNANVFNGLTYLLNPPIFVGTQAVSQALPNSSWTPISFDTTVIDTYSGHSNTVNPSRYTAQVAGWYTICGNFVTVPNNTSIRAAQIQVNGNPIPGMSNYSIALNGFETSALTAPRDVYLNVNDYVELSGWQGSGAALGGATGTMRSSLYCRFSHA